MQNSWQAGCDFVDNETTQAWAYIHMAEARLTSSETWMESSKQPIETVLALQKVGFEYYKYTESMGWDLGEFNGIS